MRNRFFSSPYQSLRKRKTCASVMANCASTFAATLGLPVAAQAQDLRLGHGKLCKHICRDARLTSLSPVVLGRGRVSTVCVRRSVRQSP